MHKSGVGTGGGATKVTRCPKTTARKNICHFKSKYTITVASTLKRESSNYCGRLLVKRSWQNPRRSSSRLLSAFTAFSSETIARHLATPKLVNKFTAKTDEDGASPISVSHSPQRRIHWKKQWTHTRARWRPSLIFPWTFHLDFEWKACVTLNIVS